MILVLAKKQIIAAYFLVLKRMYLSVTICNLVGIPPSQTSVTINNIQNFLHEQRISMKDSTNLANYLQLMKPFLSKFLGELINGEDMESPTTYKHTGGHTAVPGGYGLSLPPSALPLSFPSVLPSLPDELPLSLPFAVFPFSQIPSAPPMLPPFFNPNILPIERLISFFFV